MRVNIRASNLKLDGQLRNHIDRRVQLVLGRFSSRIRNVCVRLTAGDTLEARPEKRCRILIHLGSSLCLSAEDVHKDIYAAVDGGMERAGRAVLRQLFQWRDLSLPPQS
jgi:ribosomal subunit interface protein